MYAYSWNQWITFFFLYCFLGWVWESCYVSLKKRKWVNRGFLRLPMLPLYGFGAILMLWLSLPFTGNYLAQYCVGVIGPTILEYFTGWAMEKLFKVKYWDYSNQKIQLNGYICLSSSLAWGFFTIMMTEFLHPPFENLVLNIINPIVDYVLVIGIGILFILDTIASAKAAFDMRNALEKITEIRAQLDDIQVQISLLKAETLKVAYQAKENAIEKVSEIHNNAVVHAQEVHDKSKERMNNVKSEFAEYREEIAIKMTTLASRMNELNLRREKITRGMSSFHRGLIKGNPSATSEKFSVALKELKEHFER